MESGDREGYLDLQFAQATESLTLEERYPDQVLAFYMRGLGRLDQNMQRET